MHALKDIGWQLNLPTYQGVDYAYSSQPHRKTVQNQSHCPRWLRHRCDTGHELDEGAQGTT
jgi:hypothetical protein